jgi:hypothetical protein
LDSGSRDTVVVQEGSKHFEKGLEVRPVDRPEVRQAKRIAAGDFAGVDGKPSGVQLVSA